MIFIANYLQLIQKDIYSFKDLITYIPRLLVSSQTLHLCLYRVMECLVYTHAQRFVNMAMKQFIVLELDYNVHHSSIVLELFQSIMVNISLIFFHFDL